MGKQDETTTKREAAQARMSRKHLFALWGTLITVLGTSVVPKIIDMISDRPSVTEVQDMIAQQTRVLTETTNRHIEKMDAYEGSLHELDKSLARLQGLEESLREVVRDCCTRRVRNVSARLHPKARNPSSKPKELPPVNGAVDTVTEEKEEAAEKKQSPVQQKLPEFNPEWIQQKAK